MTTTVLPTNLPGDKVTGSADLPGAFNEQAVRINLIAQTLNDQGPEHIRGGGGAAVKDHPVGAWIAAAGTAGLPSGFENTILNVQDAGGFKFYTAFELDDVSGTGKRVAFGYAAPGSNPSWTYLKGSNTPV